MAEGTRYRNRDERLGAYDAKFTEMNSALDLLKEEMTVKGDEVNQRIDKVDRTLEELKQMIMGLQKPNAEVHSTDSSIRDGDAIGEGQRGQRRMEIGTIELQLEPPSHGLHAATTQPSGAGSNPITSSQVHTNPPILSPIMSSQLHPYTTHPQLHIPATNSQFFSHPIAYSTLTTPTPHLIHTAYGPQPFTTGPMPFNPQFSAPHTAYNFNPPQSPQFLPQSHGSHLTSLSSNPKVEFPRFDGTDPRNWITKAEQYFEFIYIEEHRKVKFAGIYFEGRASTWYRQYQVGRTGGNWRTFVQEVLSKFENPDQADVQGLFNKLTV